MKLSMFCWHTAGFKICIFKVQNLEKIQLSMLLSSADSLIL